MQRSTLAVQPCWAASVPTDTAISWPVPVCDAYRTSTEGLAVATGFTGFLARCALHLHLFSCCLAEAAEPAACCGVDLRRASTAAPPVAVAAAPAPVPFAAAGRLAWAIVAAAGSAVFLMCCCAALLLALSSVEPVLPWPGAAPACLSLSASPAVRARRLSLSVRPPAAWLCGWTSALGFLLGEAWGLLKISDPAVKESGIAVVSRLLLLPG